MSRSTLWFRRAGIAALLLVVALGVGGCRRKKATGAAKPPSTAPPAVSGLYVEEGLASWYGHPYHGRPTANGEIYDMNKMTAAHRTLPFNTWVKVTNLENQKETRLRINDRGPFIEGRIIDLSRAGAEAIAMIGPGTAVVRVEVVETPAGASIEARYGVQVGAFKVVANANRLREELSKSYREVNVVTYDAPDGLYYRVRVGRLATIEEAQKLASQLKREPDITATFVVRLD
ncbi:MAG TPA: septal ring lytic transglycosylase RlpA family protein [Candidatus Xenobia bacterium]|nr:septal ring lytic transglycosylase RlpA family protein [Candidatus Xenobia bacterium]